MDVLSTVDAFGPVDIEKKNIYIYIYIFFYFFFYYLFV